MQHTATKPPRQDEFLTIPDLAQVMRVSPRTAARWVGEGTVPSTRVGGARRVARADLDRLIEAGRTKASEPQ